MTSAQGGQRWGQLSYGSLPADPVTHAGAGWRVKESVGDVTDEESQRMLALAVTRFESHVPFPGVGQRAEVYQALPRRFGYLPSGDEALYWHAAQVDMDGAGRTGNVFSHLLLDRHPVAPSPRHAPVALWRSEGFLAPHQYALVDGARLGDEPPAPGPVVTRENLLTFLFDSAHWRVGVLAVLADAAFAALEGGPRVVLRCEDQQEAALWIGAVNAIQSMRDARRLGFSLYERGTSEHANGVDQAFARGVHIAVVPPGDEYAPAGAVVEIDPHAVVTLGQPGGQHVFADGRAVPVGVMSSLVTLCLFTAVDAAALFDAVDDVSRRTGDCPNILLSWPFAMAILRNADEYPDAAALARTVVVRGTPPQVAADPELRALAESATVQAMSDDPAQIWAELQAIPSASYAYQLVASAYLVAALGTPGWLSRNDSAPVPETPENLDAVATAAVGALDRMLATDGADPVGALRLIGFLGQVLGLGPVDPRIEGRLEDLVARTIEQLVVHPAHAEILVQAGPFDDLVLGRWIVPALDNRIPSAPGRSIYSTPPALLRGLFGASALLAPGPHAGRTDFQWDAAALALEGAAVPDAVLRDELAGRLLERYHSWAEVPRDGLGILQAASATWSTSRLLAVTAGDFSRVLPDVVIRVILTASAEDARILSQQPLLAADQRQLASWVSWARDLESARSLLPSGSEPEALSNIAGQLQGLLGRPDDREYAFVPLTAALSIIVRAQGVVLPSQAHPLLADVAAKAAADPAFTARTAPYLRAYAAADPERARPLLLQLAVIGAAAMGSEFRLSAEEAANAALRDAGGERLVDVIASSALSGAARGAVTVEDLTAALKERALGDDVKADRVAKRWWRARGLGTGIAIADNGAEFLGSLFRGRQKGEG